MYLKFIAKTLYRGLIFFGIAWFFITQLPLLMTAGTLPALLGLTISALIVAVVGQLVYNKIKGVNSTTTKENAQ